MGLVATHVTPVLSGDRTLNTQRKAIHTVDYVATLRFRPSVSAADRDAALVRRAGWQYPEGITLIAEYWPSSADLQVISIFSADDYAPVMQLVFDWNDVFDINVHPAVSAEEGIKTGIEVFSKLTRLKR